MKTLYFFVLLLVFSTGVIAQDKTLYGSFIFDGKVYKYTFNQSITGNSLQISTLEGLNDKLTGLQLSKLDSTIKFLNAIPDSFYLRNKISGDTLQMLKGIEQSLRSIRNVVENKGVWNKDHVALEKTRSLMNHYRVDTVKVDSIPQINRYDIDKLFVDYQMFLKRVVDPKESRLLIFPELEDTQEFKYIFRSGLSEIYHGNSKMLDTQMFDKTANKIFYEIKTRLSFQDLEPLTGYLILKKKFITIPMDGDYKKTLCFEVEDIHLEFEGGALKNIFADLIPILESYQGEYKRLSVRFRNNMPISVSGKFDPERFNEHKIFLGNRHELEHELVVSGIIPEDSSLPKEIFFTLSELIDYKIVPEVNKEDYSPKDCVVNISPLSPMRELRKEKSSSLFDVRLYSDFVGINEDEPNGLVQVEASKKINLITERWQGLDVVNFWKNKPSTDINVYSGFLTYVEPKFTFSKIENTNRIYYVHPEMLDTSNSLNAATGKFNINPLKVVQYQRWSFSNDLNLLKINLHNLRTTIYMNQFFALGRTTVGDSVAINVTDSGRFITSVNYENIKGVSTTIWGGSLGLEFKPDARFNIIFAYGLRRIDTYDEDYSLDTKYSKLIHLVSVNAFFKTSEVSKIFFRGQKVWLNNMPRHNFYQLQVGYELNLFGGNKLMQPK